MTFEQRLFEKISKTDYCPNPKIKTGCWGWLACNNGRGYGKFWSGGKMNYAHRIVWEHFHGPCPEGLELDHLCVNPGCVNPAHLEWVTHAENMRRGRAGQERGRQQRAKTHCPQGHPYDPTNTLLYRGKRYCRACRRETQRRTRARKRVAG